jgi:DNA-directed RNA polymerase subunit D
MTHQYFPDLKINHTKLKNPEECAKVCPRDVYSVEDSKLKIKQLEACILCKACEDVSDGDVKVDIVPDKFIVTLESWGQLPPKEILVNAADELDGLYKELQKAIK